LSTAETRRHRPRRNFEAARSASQDRVRSWTSKQRATRNRQRTRHSELARAS
jgi:hypothetical protein